MDERTEHLKIAKDLTIAVVNRMDAKEAVNVEKVRSILYSFLDILEKAFTRNVKKPSP